MQGPNFIQCPIAMKYNCYSSQRRMLLFTVMLSWHPRLHFFFNYLPTLNPEFPPPQRHVIMLNIDYLCNCYSLSGQPHPFIAAVAGEMAADECSLSGTLSRHHTRNEFHGKGIFSASWQNGTGAKSSVRSWATTFGRPVSNYHRWEKSIDHPNTDRLRQELLNIHLMDHVCKD